MTASQIQSPQTAKFGRHTLRYAVTGEGRPVLLVNGLGGNLEIWDPIVRIVAKEGYRVVTYDGPGIGASSTPRVPRTIAALARVADRLLDHIGISAVDVLGYSLGGLIAQELAHQTPSRIRRLVLAATTCGLGSRPPRPDVAVSLLVPLRYFSPAIYRRTLPGLVGGTARSDQRVTQDFVAAHKDFGFGLKAFGFQVFAGSTFSSWRWLPALRQPTLVLAGDDDPLIPIANGHLLARRIPDAKLHVIRGGGHLFLLEHARSIMPVVFEFLDQGHSRAG